MTASEYRQLREEIELTPRELAQWLGISHGEVIERENGNVPITKEAELAMEFVAYLVKTDWANRRKKGSNRLVSKSKSATT
jgi:DNA-binding XRE family transcriptional regulator